METIIWSYISLTAAVTEEFNFRAMAISSMEHVGINKWAALLISISPFMAIRGIQAFTSMNMFVFYFSGGLLLGLIYIVTKGLWPGILFHCVLDIQVL